MHILGTKKSIDEFEPLGEAEMVEIEQQLMAALASGMPEMAPVAMQLDHICRLLKSIKVLQEEKAAEGDVTAPQLIIPS